MRTNQLDNPTNYRKARRELAWILTLLHEKTGAHAASGEKKASDAGAD
jgi:ribosomal protein L29